MARWPLKCRRIDVALSACEMLSARVLSKGWLSRAGAASWRSCGFVPFSGDEALEDFALLGVPRQNSPGGKDKLGRISKMGDRYLRKLLVIGATSVVRRARTADTTAAN